MTAEQDKRLAQLKQAYESGILDQESYLSFLADAGYQAETGSGATAQGPGATAVGQQAVYLGPGASFSGTLITGNGYQGEPTDDPAEALRIYRQVLVGSSASLPLRGIDVGASDPAGEQQGLGLAHVYIDLDTKTAVPLDEKSQRRPMGEAEHKPLPALAAAARNRRLVLLGDPGGGKTTFVHHLAHCLAAHALEPAAAWDEKLPAWPKADLDLLPIVVILRDFAQGLGEPLPERAEPKHLWDFIIRRLADQNLAFVSPTIRQALDQGRCLLLFDGLDEVTTVAQRRFVRDAVQGFVSRYPANRYLITCRTLSYQPPLKKSAPDLRLRSADFPAFELAPFDEAKINRFISAWYTELALVGTVRAQDRAGLIEQLQTAVHRPDLRQLAANPLLLTVMALVHAHKGRLPDARALLYEETIEMLLWRWERVKAGSDERSQMRQLLLSGGLADMDLKKVLWQLAYEAHGQGGQNEQGLADIDQWRLTQALAELVEGEGLDWASRVVEAMKLRAGLLLERAPGTFTFPHRTFQEYLAGAHLSTQPDFPTRSAQLAAQGDLWRVVILLAVGRLVYLTGDTAKPLTLVAELCPAETGGDEGWQGAWLAGEVLLEMGLKRANNSQLGRELVQRVQARLVALVGQGQLAPRERAEAGIVLASLADPRPGVGVRLMDDKQLPDMAFCYIPAGDFWMGSDESDPEAQKYEQPQHRLTLPYSYWLGKYPVTVAQYETFVAAGGYKNEKYWTEAKDNRQWQDGQVKEWRGGWRERPYNHGERFNTPNHPVVGLTWYEALAFCRWLTEQVVLPDGCELTLPSEAEWEKGARGGLLVPETAVVADLLAGLPDKPLYDLVENNAPKRRYPWGQAFGPEQSNFDATGIQATCSVGIFPNDVSSYGLVDLGGNVFEWMRTVWGKDFEEPDFNYPYVSTDGREALLSADLRVLRGGVWPGGSEWLRCAARYWNYPHIRINYIGFRVVMRPHFSPADER